MIRSASAQRAAAACHRRRARRAPAPVKRRPRHRRTRAFAALPLPRHAAPTVAGPMASPHGSRRRRSLDPGRSDPCSRHQRGRCGRFSCASARPARSELGSAQLEPAAPPPPAAAPAALPPPLAWVHVCKLWAVEDIKLPLAKGRPYCSEDVRIRSSILRKMKRDWRSWQRVSLIISRSWVRAPHPALQLFVAVCGNLCGRASSPHIPQLNFLSTSAVGALAPHPALQLFAAVCGNL